MGTIKERRANVYFSDLSSQEGGKNTDMDVNFYITQFDRKKGSIEYA